MRVLLITYEFPPIESAQALRWYYLSNQLVAQGVHVTVIAPELIQEKAANAAVKARLIRSYPGPFIGVSGWLSRKSGHGNAKASTFKGPQEESKAELVYRKLRRALDHIVFPDVRSEWYPFAARSLARFKPGDFDLIIAAHEPGVDLMLGLSASKRLKAPLVIDLADPLVTPYSPGWRKRWDIRLERKASQHAAGIITTSSMFSQSLMRQHGLSADQVIEVEQGFESSQQYTSPKQPNTQLPQDGFWLLFTGNFYEDFRNPWPLVEALKKRSGIRFVFAGATPDWLMEMFDPLGDQVVCLGRLSHQEAVAIQRLAPVLFNLGNQQALQVPGKLFEYFGAGRPILHVALNPDDPSGDLLRSLRRGIATDDKVDQIVEALDRMKNVISNKETAEEWDLRQEAVAEYSWKSLSQRLTAFLETCTKR
jgi:glycosyltransferase involved in cell wall biosynthesis